MNTNEKPLVDFDFDVPNWIEQDISALDVETIVQGGCASGAYMPAVTYHSALKTMNEQGDEVLQYIEDTMGELPTPDKDISWSGLACFYLSCAVELWANIVIDEVQAKMNELESEE